MNDSSHSSIEDTEKKALHNALLRSYKNIRKGVLGYNWEEVEQSFRSFCAQHSGSIPQWFVNEYVFQAMRRWADDDLDEVLRHFANFMNRAAEEEIINAIAEREQLRQALDSPFEQQKKNGS